MSKTRIIVAICICCMLGAAMTSDRAAAGDNPYEKAIATARSEIWKAINTGRCGSATAAIMVDGRIVYAEGFGMADREKSIPVTPATIFNIGSISKVHVATAIMLLVDDGKVVLDKPVTEYLPEFTMADHRYRKITVRMLLNHTSGMPGTQAANTFGYIYDDNAKRETLNTLSRARLKHAPGANAVYCNDGFTLAEMIVERVSRVKYIDFLNRRIFKPLGLKNTGMGVGEIRNKPVAAYYEAATGKRQPLETISILGAGGLSSTAGELCRFADAFSAGSRLLTGASLAEMKKAQPSALRGKLKNPTFSYGLGWDITGLPRYDAAGIQVLGKSGGTGNYSSMVYAAPHRRIAVALFASGAESGAMNVALDIFNEVLIAKGLIAREKKEVPVPPEAQKLPENDFSYGGYYASDSKFGQLVFDKDKNSITLYGFKEKEKAPLMTLVYNNGYYHDGKGNLFYFAAADGERYLVAHVPVFGIDTILVQKVNPMEKPQNLRIDMDGRIWLRRNVSPFEAMVVAESHLVKSILHKDIPGYVHFISVKRIESPDFAGMPFDAVRDQTELALFDKEGATWAQVSDMLYSPSETAIALKKGENTVKIGKSGHNEWLKAREGMVLSFAKSAKGRVIIFSSDDRTVYDSAVDSGDVYVAAGSFIECAGLAGDVFTVRASPAAVKLK